MNIKNRLKKIEQTVIEDKQYLDDLDETKFPNRVKAAQDVWDSLSEEEKEILESGNLDLASVDTLIKLRDVSLIPN